MSRHVSALASSGAEIKPLMESDLSKPIRLAESGRRVVVFCGEPGMMGGWWSNCLTNCAVPNPDRWGSKLLAHIDGRFGVCAGCQVVKLCLVGNRLRCECGSEIVSGSTRWSDAVGFNEFRAVAKIRSAMSAVDVEAPHLNRAVPIGAVVEEVMREVHAHA